MHFIDHKLGQPEALPTIRPNTEQWDVWREYFERFLGFLPETMRLVLDKPEHPEGSGFTVPCEFPQIFDGRFVEEPGWKPAPREKVRSNPYSGIDDLRARYGPNWGLQEMKKSKGKKPPWKPLSDDELRAHYPRRRAAAE